MTSPGVELTAQTPGPTGSPRMWPLQAQASWACRSFRRQTGDLHNSSVMATNTPNHHKLSPSTAGLTYKGKKYFNSHQQQFRIIKITKNYEKISKKCPYRHWFWWFVWSCEFFQFFWGIDVVDCDLGRYWIISGRRVLRRKIQYFTFNMAD